MLDDEARWCATCTIIQEVEEEARAATCADCIASDLNKDVLLQDPFFGRCWRAVQLKRAGVPVLELVSSLDEVLSIAAVEGEIERLMREKAREEAEQGRRTQGGEDEH